MTTNNLEFLKQYQLDPAEHSQADWLKMQAAVDEQDNILHLFWTMMVSIQSRAEGDDGSIMDRHEVDAAIRLLKRIEYLPESYQAPWVKKEPVMPV